MIAGLIGGTVGLVLGIIAAYVIVRKDIPIFLQQVERYLKDTDWTAWESE